MDEIRISVIVPTYNRPDDLLKCIKSVSEQSLKPHELIIINDGELSGDIETRLRSIAGSIPVNISSSDGLPSTSTARNTGAKVANGNIVLILDDDVVLGESYLSRLKKNYNKYDNCNLAGIGGFDDRLRTKTVFERIYDRIFFLGCDGWRVNRIGMQSWSSEINSIEKGDWLSGNNASFKRSFLLENPYPHWMGGREALEDIAMGKKVKNNGYYCLIDPELPLTHNEGDKIDSPFKYGLKAGNNRTNIFFEYCNKLYLPIFVWAFFGTVLRQFLSPIVDGDAKEHWSVGCGMIMGGGTGMVKKVFQILTW